MGRKKSEKHPEKPEERITTVSFFGIFRYATCLEISATIFGVILAFLSGGGITFCLVQFGELSTSFVERKLRNGTSSYLPLLIAFGGGRRLTNPTVNVSNDALMEDGRAMGLGMTASILVSLTLCILSVMLLNWSSLRQISRIRIMFLQAVLRQDMSYFDTDTSMNLASRMSDDLVKLKEGMGDKLAIVGNLVGTAIINICIAFPLGWELTLACLTVVPFSIAASVALSNYQAKSSARELDSYSVAGKQAEEVLKSVRTVVAFGGEETEVKRYERLLEPAERYGRHRSIYTGIGTGFSWVLTYSLNTIGLAYGTRLVVDDWYQPVDQRRYVVGDILSILFNIYMATQSITLCVPHGESFAAARAAATNIYKILERIPAIDSLSPYGETPPRVRGEITLNDVYFNYPSRPDVKILKGLSLSVKPGETVALVGSSGCGKSTILQLVQRLYDPQSGSVRIDGRDVKNLNLSWLRSTLGVVGQEPVLFRGTIHENIAIGTPNATRENVQKVAEMAFAHDFIMHLSDGYDTMIGERGASLSGGQKQRIAIARSLLRDPAILLLDEATSALDPHSEKQVQAALDRACVGRTTLVVSHRLSTIVNASRIICMDQGVIVEQGTHEELMKTKGSYWKLVTTGNEGKEPDVIETVPEEEDNVKEPALQSRVDIKRRSTRRIHRHHSVKRDSHDWMTPRGSISSVMSTGLQNFVYNIESDSEDSDKDDDEHIPPVNDWQLLKLNGPEWPLLLVGSIAAFIQGACFPMFALLFGLAMGVFAYQDDARTLHESAIFSGMFIVIAAIAGVTMCLQSVTFTTAGLKMTTRLRVQCFSSYLKQEIGYFDRAKNAVGSLCARLSGDAAEVQGATGLRIGLIIQGVSSVTVGFIMGCCYNWKLTFVGAAFLPLMVGSVWLEGIVSQKSQADERDAMESATTLATEAAVSIRTVQSLGVEKLFLEKYIAALMPACKAIASKTRWRGLVFGLGIYVPFLAYCSASIYGVYLITHGDLEYQTVLLVTEATMYGAYMLGQSLVYAPNFNAARMAGARLLFIIKRQPNVRTSERLKDKKDWVASGAFHFKDIEFSYPTRPHQQVLKGIDLKAEAGKTIALVGPSGCGKSTVLQLLQRFYDPAAGNIELDGRDIKASLTLTRLRRQLGVVQQEPVLFERTLGENIAYGDNYRKVSTQEIIAAAKAANIHNFIISLPKGYDTHLGSAGSQLSGGQRQRICIARALIRSPRLLLLDEATSALDANSEKAVSEALEVASKGRTCITIAHRLSTIKDADLICVFEKGRIVERGTHTELMALRGHYWRMKNSQGIES